MKKADPIRSRLFLYLVPGAGVEPAHAYAREILSLFASLALARFTGLLYT